MRLLSALTGIRFFAAMAVYFFHFGAGYSERVGMPAPLTQLLRNGYIGVSVFFVLSGFILFYNYRGSIKSKFDFFDYMIARLARVYPVYVLALVVALPVTDRPLDWTSAGRVLSMTQSWTLPEANLGFSWLTQAWTLSVELFFYMLFPLVALVVARAGSLGALLISFFSALLIVITGSPSLTPSADPTMFSTATLGTPIPVVRALEFTYGVALCRWLSDSEIRPRWCAGDLSCTLILFSGLAVLCFARSPSTLAIATIIFGIFIAQIAFEPSWLQRALSKPALVFAGGASYSLYLLQGPVHYWIKTFTSGITASILQLAVTLLVSGLVFRWFEEPARNLVRRFAKKRDRATSADVTGTT